MDYDHREVLRKNQVNLVESLMMDSNLLDYLKEQNVITAGMEEEIKVVH